MSRTIGAKSYARIPDVLTLPNLIEIQLDSFNWFVTEGLRDLFDEVSPIESFDGSLKLLGAIGDVVLTPRMEGKAAPYVVGGAGMVQFKNGESDWDLAWNAGGGVRIAAGNLGVYVEARFLQARGNGVTTNMIPITAGVRIGGN